MPLFKDSPVFNIVKDRNETQDFQDPAKVFGVFDFALEFLPDFESPGLLRRPFER